MSNIQLSKRLNAACEMVTPGSRVADVGTDHGFVPIYLIQNKIAVEKKCTAVLNSLLHSETNEEDLREYQKWQVLVLNPLLAPQFVYEHKDNTAICLQEDGSYLVVENDDEV